MLTQKELRRLRQSVRYNRWLPAFYITVAALSLVVTCLKLSALHKFCSSSGRPYSDVLNLAFVGPDPDKTYEGFEIKIGQCAEDAFGWGCIAILSVVLLFAVRWQYKKDMLLLNYIDKEQGTQPSVRDGKPAP